MAVNETFTLADGESLNLGVARGAVFGYLAIEGGVQGEPMFGSLAVNARAGLGSPYPRPLQAGDELRARTASGTPERRIDLPPSPDGPIRVLWGPQDDEFDDANKALFLGSEWRISATSDRMGYRLEGPAIRHRHGHNIVSDGTVNGSIQVPGNGAPIVLMPDRGTSGGYPKIATVISADLGRFGQTQAGRGFRFTAVGMARGAGRIPGHGGLAARPARARPRRQWVGARPRGAAQRQCRRQRGQCGRRPDMAADVCGRQQDSTTQAEPSS